MLNKFFSLLILIGLVGVGCREKLDAKHEKHKEAEATDLLIRANREIIVPKDLVKFIEKWYVEDRRSKEKMLTSSEQEIVAEIERQLFNVSVHIAPMNDDELVDESDLKIPTGGGIIDFSEILHGDRGGFTLAMNVSGAPEGSEMRAFYVSRARQRSLSDSEYGAGCEKWMEVTKWFAQHRSGHPVELYATDRRHISVLAGSWLIVAIHEKQLWFGTLSFTDSRFPALMCSS